MTGQEPTGPTFADNRGWGIAYPYRDPDLERDFPALVRASASMISNSYGWAPNRAWKIYAEAWEENAGHSV